MPTRRLVAVTVMFLGLIVPGAFLGLRLLGFYCIGIAPLGLSVVLACNLAALWKGKPGAWLLAFAAFGCGFLLSGVALGCAVLEGDRRTIPWAAAATAHFAVGLLAIFSLRAWIRELEWKLKKDPLATADKAAVLAALRARKR
jgi:hypothetical protein